MTINPALELSPNNYEVKQVITFAIIIFIYFHSKIECERDIRNISYRIAKFSPRLNLFFEITRSNKCLAVIVSIYLSMVVFVLHYLKNMYHPRIERFRRMTSLRKEVMVKKSTQT